MMAAQEKDRALVGANLKEEAAPLLARAERRHLLPRNDVVHSSIHYKHAQHPPQGTLVTLIHVVKVAAIRVLRKRKSFIAILARRPKHLPCPQLTLHWFKLQHLACGVRGLLVRCHILLRRITQRG
jgi:hypothetical protein